MTTRDDREAFLERWSRVKQEAKHQPPQKAPEKAVDPKASAPELPPIDKLTLESDYRDFFHPKVGEDVRRAALKKLFSDPRFNVMDGLDVYIDDYSKNEPIPPEMLAGLRQAQKILEWAKGEEKEAPADRAAPEPIEAARPEALEPPEPTVSPVPAAVGQNAESSPSVPDRDSGSRSTGNA